MYNWLVTATLFSSVLTFGNKYIYATTHRHVAWAALACTIVTYALLFMTNEIGTCTVPKLPERMTVFFILILGEFGRVIYGGAGDVLLPAIVCAHIVARRSDSPSTCELVHLGAAAAVVLTAVVVVGARKTFGGGDPAPEKRKTPDSNAKHIRITFK